MAYLRQDHRHDQARMWTMFTMLNGMAHDDDVCGHGALQEVKIATL